MHKRKKPLRNCSLQAQGSDTSSLHYILERLIGNFNQVNVNHNHILLLSSSSERCSMLRLLELVHSVACEHKQGV